MGGDVSVGSVRGGGITPDATINVSLRGVSILAGLVSLIVGGIVSAGAFVREGDLAGLREAQAAHTSEVLERISGVCEVRDLRDANILKLVDSLDGRSDEIVQQIRQMEARIIDRVNVMDERITGRINLIESRGE